MEMTQMTQMTQTLLGNTKPKARSRKWTFTLNNWSIEEYDNIINEMTQKHTEYIIGKEIGENETPHLQGFIQFKNAVTFESMKKKIPRAHIEQAKGNIEQNYKYCSKDGDFITNIIIEKTMEEKYDEYMHSRYDNITWKPWQKEILDLIETPADDRTVHWYWEQTGNVGKSFLIKYIDWKYNAIIADGKKADIFNQYKTYLETEKDWPTVALLDIPRSHQDYVCYQTLEKIKDGLIYSGKYEGGKLRLIPHHLVVFSNFPPEFHKLSNDRWHVTMLSEV